MYYYIHEDYGYIACSEPPPQDREKYTLITEQEFQQYLDKLNEDKENGVSV